MTATALLQKAVPIALLCLSLAPPAMAQGVGAIGGTVQDATGGALPGVSVSLSNPGVIGGNQQTVTDARGTYQFARLVPSSTYTVQAELPGFGTATGNGIVVNADATTRLDLMLQLAGVAETLTVSGAAPLVDTTSVFNQTVMERATLDALPSGRDLWTIARIVPGVLMNAYDVGGSASMLQGSATVHGATLSENTYMVDGMDVAAPTTPGSTNSYFDTSMFEQVNYQTGNSSAESEFGGIVYNMVTKTGTNVFHGSGHFTGSNSSLNANNITPALRTDLQTFIPARVLQANPNIEPLGKTLIFYNAEAGLTGPLVRNKLWFTGSGNQKRLDQLKVGSYNPDGTQFVNDNRQRNYGSKLSWQVTRGSQLHYTHQWSQRIAYHRVGGSADFYESRAVGIQDVNSTLDIVNWTAVLSSRLVLDLRRILIAPGVARSPSQR